MEQAQYYFQRAVEKDPNFALAYLGLADTAFMGGDNPEAYGAVAKAIELDSSLGEAYATSGFASMFHKWDWQKAEDYFKQSILLNPGYGIAHQWYATLLAITGRIEEAKQEMHRALEIDPTSANFLADMGQMYYFARQYEEAERYCRKALEMSPDFVFAHSYLYDICLQTGRTNEALEEFVKFAASFLSSGSKYEATAGITNNLTAQEKLLRESYQQAEIKGLWRYIINTEQRSRAPGFAYGLAKSYTLMKDQQKALNWLEKSYENREFFLPFMKSDPVFGDLHSQPRYQEILRKMNLN